MSSKSEIHVKMFTWNSRETKIHVNFTRISREFHVKNFTWISLLLLNSREKFHVNFTWISREIHMRRFCLCRSVSVGFNCVSLTRISSTDNGSSERVIVVTFSVSSGRHSVERQQNTSEIPESVWYFVLWLNQSANLWHGLISND